MSPRQRRRGFLKVQIALRALLKQRISVGERVAGGFLANDRPSAAVRLLVLPMVIRPVALTGQKMTQQPHNDERRNDKQKPFAVGFKMEVAEFTMTAKH